MGGSRREGGREDWYSSGRPSGPEGKAGIRVCEFHNRGAFHSVSGGRCSRNICFTSITESFTYKSSSGDAGLKRNEVVGKSFMHESSCGSIF